VTSSTYDPWQKQTDRFSLLLGFFFIVLLILFVYLMKIDRDIKNYDEYHRQLEQMRILDYQFDNFFFRTYRYINYDETSRLEKEFEEKISFFKVRDIQQEFGLDIDEQIKRIIREYYAKKVYFEDFKALNARVTNSIHFLFDLRKTLEQELLESPEKKRLTDSVFFSISQILMDIPYDEKKIKKELEALNDSETKVEKLLFFSQHSKQFLLDVEAIRKMKQQVGNIPLREEIDTLLVHLENQYQKRTVEQTFIALSLFIFAFVILGILIVGYRRIRKYTKELQAFRYAIEKSDNAIVITNVKRQIEYVNRAFEERSGYKRSEVMGKNPNILKSDLMSDDFYKALNGTLDRGEIWQGELINKRKNGELLYEKSSIIPIVVEGELVQYLAIKLDITEYKKQQQYLRLSGIVYEMIGDGIIVTDKEKHIISANPAFIEMFGYSKEELIGNEPMVIQTLKEDTYFYSQMWDQLLTNDRWSGKLHNQTKDGTVLPIWLTLAVVRDEGGEIENFIAIYTNLQEIIATQERAEYLAYHDSLTGLPNRAYFDLRINDMFSLAQKAQKQVALFFMDLDRFKVINDTLGHAIGDAMLIKLSARIQSIFDKETLFARIGGDEFVVMKILEKGREEASETAEKILSVVREPIKVYDYHLNTTVSIGIAVFPDDAKEKYEIVKYADSAMYAAKESGKDTYQFYNRKLSQDVQKRLDLEQELKHALDRNELLLHYQPQYLLDSGEIVGVEALLRWHNQNLGMVPPDEFISIAEETGMIVKIGYFVFEEACKAYMRWKSMGHALETVAVNVSAVQFRDENFLKRVQEIFQVTGISPESVEIEITERFIMEYSTTNMTILEDLRKLGCKISIDDFGTGYSSMSYMKQLPLDMIKIDRSFITELPYSTHDMEVSKAIIALAQSLGYRVVAEGIENEAQESFLKEYHCNIGQGYYFAKPMDEARLIAFFESK
jgi:diguanylate cyclase (GGDEF)-like protein/PAS domain S-box-containing protein